MKKVFAIILALALALSMVACGGAKKNDATDIAVLVPNADHGWTGAVIT